MTPQEESNIKMVLPLELVSQFFGFHLNLSLHVEILTIMPSGRKMMPTTPSSLAQARLSPKNMHTMRQYSATGDPDSSTRPEGEVATPDPRA